MIHQLLYGQILCNINHQNATKKKELFFLVNNFYYGLELPFANSIMVDNDSDPLLYGNHHRHLFDRLKLKLVNTHGCCCTQLCVLKLWPETASHLVACAAHTKDI